MTSTDDILNQIDHTLRDWTVGPDAMRSQPAEHADEASLDLSSGDGGGAWEEVDIDALEITFNRLPGLGLDRLRTGGHGTILISTAHTADGARPAQELRDEFIASMARLAQHVREVNERHARAVIEALRTIVGASRQSEWVDTNGDPVEEAALPRPPLPRRDGRPAWQTPYGPRRRR